MGDLADIGRQLRILAPDGRGIVGLDIVAARLDNAQQADAVRALDQALYAGKFADSREALLTQLRAALRMPLSWRKRSAGTADDAGLPPLYASDVTRKR